MNVQNKQPIKQTQMKLTVFYVILMLILLISVSSQPNKILFNQSYYLLSNSDKIFIPVNKTNFNLNNNGVMKFLKVHVKIQILNQNGIYVDSPFQTGNILVKYWKNHQNTTANDILTFSYDHISMTKQFPTALDLNDNGIVDIEALYNYNNQHNFFHIVGNQNSEILFVLAVYRFQNYGLSDLFGMSKRSDEIKITVTVQRGSQSDNRCQFCSSKQFCPVNNQCICSQQTYSGCEVVQKKILKNVDKQTKMSQKGSIMKGEIQYFQIQAESNQREWFPVEIGLQFQDSDNTMNKVPQKDKVFLFLHLRNKNDTTETIPNIYNFDIIDSPSLNNKITYQPAFSTLANVTSNSPINVRLNQNSITITEKILVSKEQAISAAIYYLNDTEGSPTPSADFLSVSMQIDFKSADYRISGGESLVNLALIIGMVALGLFVLFLLICILHFLVSKKCSLLGIFNHMQSTNRHSVNSPRYSRRQDSQDKKLVLPSVSFDFLNDLVFKPLKFICQKNLQLNNSKLISEEKKTSQQNEMCPICLEEFSNNSKVKYTYCGHILDSKCLDSWLQKQMSCPMCRQKLQPQQVAEYQDRILQQIVENQYYQSIIDQEAQKIKNMYKHWKNKKDNGRQIVQNTEESLVNNEQIGNFLVQGKPEDNFMTQNIPTMIQLQNTYNGLNQKENSNKKIFQSPSQICMNSSSYQIDFDKIFMNNQQFSVKRFGKNYLFYRCIFLHHKINKNFEKNSGLNLYNSDLFVQKDVSIICESKRQNVQQNQNENNLTKTMVCSVESQPFYIKPRQQIQESLELYLNSEIKVNKRNYQEQNSQTKKNFTPEISLYFETENMSNENQKQQNSNMQKDQSYVEQSMKKSVQQKKSQDHKVSQLPKHKRRRNKEMTIRQEMNELQRELQQEEKQQRFKKQQMRFSQNGASIILFDESQDENMRYAAAPVSVFSCENKSQSSKNCNINKTQVLVLTNRKKQITLGQQTLKTLPYSVCLNDQKKPFSYRKISQHHQKQKPHQKMANKKFNLEQM